jgi:hypothetical protein
VYTFARDKGSTSFTRYSQADLTDAEIAALEEAGAKGPPVLRSSWMSTDLPRAIVLILFVAMFYVVGRPTWIL